MSKFLIVYIVMSQMLRVWLEKERGQTFDQFMKRVERAR